MKCPKCKTKMKYIKTEWGDDNHGNCGNVELYECPRCKYQKYKETDDGFSYYPG